MPTLWALAPLCVSDKLIWGWGARPGAGGAAAGAGCATCLWCWEGPSLCRSSVLAGLCSLPEPGGELWCLAAGTARQGKGGLDLVEGSRHGTHAGATSGVASRRLGRGGRQRVPRVATALGLHTQQVGTLEEFSHRTQRVVLVQGTAGWLAG